MSKFRRRNFGWLHLLLVIQIAAFCLPQMVLAAGDLSVATRTLKFPKDFSIGTLLSVGHDNHRAGSDEQPLKAACGTVKVSLPKDRWLMLELNRKGYENPQCLDVLAHEDIDVLKISFLAMDDNETNLCDRALSHANHIKSLKCLLLDKSDTSDKSIMQLTDLPNLLYISANYAEITGDCFKNLAKFPRLKTLILFDNPLKAQCFQYLPLAPKLSYLDLHDAKLDDAGVKSIAQLSELEELRMGLNPLVTDASVKYLLNLKHLYFLDLSFTGITYAGVKSLSPLKIHELFVSPGMCSPKEMASLKTLFAHVVSVGKSRKVDANTREMYAPLH